MDNLTAALWEIYQAYAESRTRYDNQLSEPTSEQERVFQLYKKQKEDTGSDFAFYISTHREKAEQLLPAVAEGSGQELAERLKKLVEKEVQQYL